MSGPDDLAEARRGRTRARLVRWAGGVGAALVLAALVAVAWFSPLLAVSEVTAEGGGIVDAETVRADAEAATLGVPLPQVRLSRLGEELAAQHTAAASIDVSYAGPRSLHVEVVDRVPVVAIVSGGSATRYDAGGAAIDEVPADGLELPVLRVDDGADAAAAARDGAVLIDAIGAAIPVPVEELRATAAGDFEMRVRTDDGTAQIVFGSAEDGERKARTAAILLEEGHERIDVSVPDVPVAG